MLAIPIVVGMSGLEELAVELDRRARRVDAVGEQLVREAADALWTSVAADAFRAQVQGRRAQCHHAAVALQAAATGMRGYASAAEAERARLARAAETALWGVRTVVHLIGSV